MATTLETLTKIAGGELINAPVGGEVEITSIGLDSATLAPGALFAALPGTKTHGASFASNTQAAAILTDEAGQEILNNDGVELPTIVVKDIRSILGAVSAEIYGHPSEDLTVIGITGTSGKTTTSYLLEAGLMACGLKVGLIGTTGTRINGKPVPTSLTTPEAPTLQALFSTMRAEGVTHVVMEVSSHALSLGRVGGTSFAAAGFTNLSQDHLDFHNSMEEYFQAKALFFDPASPYCAKKSVICIDDGWGKRMADVAQSPIMCATSPDEERVSQIWSSQIVSDPQGAQTFDIRFSSEPENPVSKSIKHYSVALPLPGRFNVANATLAIGLAHAVGVDISKVIAGVAEVKVPGRMEKIDEGQDFLCVVDYAHKPAAVAAVLDTVRTEIKGRLAVVIGAGGDRDVTKRPIMGKEAAQRANLVIITDDNPRSEEPVSIRKAVLEGAEEAADIARAEGRQVEVHESGDRRAAIQMAIDWARAGDGVVIAGKGHEVGQLIKGVKHHFDDREEAAAAIKEKLAKN